MRPLIAALALLTATTLQAAITATILDEAGKPLTGARVRAFSREENGALRKRLLSKEPEKPAIVTATTADDGRVSLDVKGEPVVLLVADAAGRAVQVIDAVDGRDAGSFVLPKAAPLKGHVTDGSKPVANVLVVAGQWYLTHTDARGEYDAPALAGGFERMFFIHPDYAIAEQAISATDSRRKPAYDLSLSKGVAIKGRVLAAVGNTLVPHAVVSVAGWPLAESDESGSFSISHAPQSWRAVFARAPKFVGVAMNRGGTKPTDIKLAPALSLSGTVKSATTTVAGSYVSLFSELDPGPPGAVSNSKGRFTIDGLLAGRYILFGTHPDFNVNRAPLDLSASTERTLTAMALVPVIGHVVDEERKPVAGARVGVNLATIPGGTSMPRPATTSAAGEFTTRIFPDSNVQFAVSKPGYALGVAGPLTAEKARNVTITLPAGFPATIRVIDRQHNPVAGAVVEILRATENPGERRTPLPCAEVRDDCRTTKADGTLAERLVEGKYDLQVTGDELAPKRMLGQLLTARAATAVITVERGAQVSGRVTQSDGTPVGGAVVTVRGSLPRSAVAAADGTFTLKGLAAGPVSITASTSDTTPPMSSAPTAVTAPAKDVVLRIPTPTSVSGRVIEKSGGRPITDFQVMALSGDQGFMRPSPASPIHSDDGTFIVQAAPGRTELRVMASGYVRATLGGLTVEEGKPLSGIEVKMDRGGRVVGHVTSHGEPVSGVNISSGANTGATTDANGDYVLDSVEPGDRTLQARKQGLVPLEKGVTAKAGEDVRLDLELDSGRELAGRVLDRGGHPLDSARIQIRGVEDRTTRTNTTTDPDGNFKISGLPAGHVALVIEHQGYVSATMEDVDPAQNVTITLDRGGAISGHVAGLTDADSGTVTVWAGYATSGSQANAGSDGSFTIQGVPDGPVSVSATKTGAQTRRSAPKTVTVTNGSAPFVELDFAEGISVTGRVTREGKPVSGGSVNFSNTKGAGGGYSEIGPDGSYQVNGLQAGEYRVIINPFGANAMSTQQNLTVAGSMTHDLDLTGRSLRGHVVDGSSGAPLSDVNVQLRPVRPGSITFRIATTDSDGRFTVDLLDDGQYHLFTQRRQYATFQQDVSIPSQDLELRLSATAAAMVRVVDGATGQPIAAEVSVVDATTRTPVAYARATVDTDAKLFLADGRYTMNVNAAGYTMVSLPLVVPSPEVQVTMQRGGTISFRLHGTESSYSVRLLVNGQEARAEWINANYQTSITGVVPGSYVVEVTSADRKTPHGKYPVSVQAGQTVIVDVN
jgi:large repetitive protein